MMEKKAQKMQNVGSSDCWSLCSDQYPSGRFPKVSIGIMAEKYPKMGSLVRKEDGAAVADRGRASSCQGKVVEENRGQLVEENRGQLVEENKGPEIVETLEVKQAKDKDLKASAWFSSRSVRHETPTTETVQLYVNQASVVQSEDGVRKKLDTIAYGKRKEKGENIERVEEVVEEVAFATVQETQLLDKEVGGEEAEKVAKCNNKALKMKLWEILGTAPQNKHTVNSPNLEEEKENLNINHNREYRRGRVSQPKHNSDTIETDSESPNQTTRRPITRSLTRRRVSPKTVSKLQGGINNGKKPLSSSGSDSKLKHQEKNIFAFDEGKTESLERTVSGHSNRSKVKINEQKTAETEPQRIYFRKPLVPQKGLQPNERKQTLPSPDETSLQSKETRGSPSSPCQGKADFMQTPNMQKKARMRSQSIYSPRQLVLGKKLQPNGREQTLPPPDRASVKSRETGSSPSLCPGKKGFMQTSSLQEKAKLESQKIYSLRPLVSEKNFQPNEREQTLPSPDRASEQSKEAPNDSHHSQTDAHKDFENLPFADYAETREITDGPLLRKKKHSWEHVMSPQRPKDSYLHKMVASPLERKTDLLDDFLSPTLAMNATPPSPSSGKLLDEVFSSPVLAKLKIPSRKGYSSKSLDNSRLYPLYSCGSDANTESSDDAGKIHGSRDTKFQHVKEKETGKKSSLSPMEDQDTESFEAGDVTSKGFRQTDKWFPDAGSLEKSPSALCHSKSVCRNKNTIPCSGLRQAENWFPDAGSHKKSPFTIRQSKRVNSLNDVELRTEGTAGFHKTSEQYPENSLESDVVELALVLERFKAKLKSHTSNKSFEILSAAAEKIHLQLQDLESQMQADVGKFINTGKSKRKRFESRLQGQQESLRLIHDKFKEAVDQQIQNCRSTLEELEAHQMELKGSTDRQKASHRKLLLQVEEAMKAELRETETRIAAIDKEARKKMYGLKHVLKEWMEDGVIR